jgi:hypothetical protein
VGHCPSPFPLKVTSLKPGSKKKALYAALCTNADRSPNSESIRIALAQIAPVLGGWEAITAKSPKDVTAFIASHLGKTLSVAEVASCLEVPEIPSVESD